MATQPPHPPNQPAAEIGLPSKISGYSSGIIKIWKYVSSHFDLPWFMLISGWIEEYQKETVFWLSTSLKGTMVTADVVTCSSPPIQKAASTIYHLILSVDISRILYQNTSNKKICLFTLTAISAFIWKLLVVEIRSQINLKFNVFLLQRSLYISAASKGRSTVNYWQSMVFDCLYLLCNDHCNWWFSKKSFSLLFPRNFFWTILNLFYWNLNIFTKLSE